MKNLLLACLLVLVLSDVAFSINGKIKTVIVLMMENRSFDHMCGYLKKENNEINGVTGNEYNTMNASDPNSPRIYVSPTAPFVDPDPAHSVPTVAEQVFGVRDCRPNDDCFIDPPPMNGFVQNAESIFEGFGNNVMRCFDPEDVPVLSDLAREFAVFDAWYSSIPGNTQPNRFYLHAATSSGMSGNDVAKLAIGFDIKTIFESMEEAGYTFGSYFQEVPGTLFFKWLRKPANWSKFHHFSTFKKHAAEGTLPNYVFIDPRYFDVPGAPANDDHPSHDVSEGQRLMKEVYEAIRNGPQWEESMLLITYDEHGGFFDHQPTPLTNIPNPDGKNSFVPYVFDFERLGVRVPTVVVSPWVNKGTVVHGPPPKQRPTESSEYDHSSVHATLKNMFGLKNFLTKRDAWAGTFEHIFNRTTIRTDCPTELRSPKKSLRHVPLTGLNPLTELQEEFVSMAAALTGETVNAKKMNVLQGSNFIKTQVNKFFGKDLYLGTQDEIRQDI